MSIGSRVRSLLGPRLEQTAANGYRRLFVDLDSLAERVADLGPFSSVIEFELLARNSEMMTCARSEAAKQRKTRRKRRNFITGARGK